jgi:hypothetical protein
MTIKQDDVDTLKAACRLFHQHQRAEWASRGPLMEQQAFCICGEPTGSSTACCALANLLRELRMTEEQLAVERACNAPMCQFCGLPAACHGSYEGSVPDYSCSECCGHGQEDGWCELLEDETEPNT